jgi:hypothetical protein
MPGLPTVSTLLTGPSVVKVTSDGKATRVLGSNDQNTAQVPDPASASPFDQWTPALSTGFQAADVDNAMRPAASAAGSLASVGALDRKEAPDPFKCQADYDRSLRRTAAGRSVFQGEWLGSGFHIALHPTERCLERLREGRQRSATPSPGHGIGEMPRGPLRGR